MNPRLRIATRLHAAVVCCFLIWLPPASAQQPVLTDNLLDHLTGDWVLTGIVLKQQTTHDVEIAWVLNHQFLRLHEVSREGPGPKYEAIVLLGWDAKKSQYVVYWTDVYGGGFSLRGYAPKSEGSIPIVFKGDEGNFYTTFSFDEKADSWKWAMDNEENGKKSEFARFTMVRKAAR